MNNEKDHILDEDFVPFSPVEEEKHIDSADEDFTEEVVTSESNYIQKEGSFVTANTNDNINSNINNNTNANVNDENQKLENLLGEKNIIVNKESLMEDNKNIFDHASLKTELSEGDSTNKKYNNIFFEENLNDNNDNKITSVLDSDQTLVKEKTSKTKSMQKAKQLIYKNSRIIPVIAFLFVSVLGVYIFINNVNANEVNLIKIEENSKVGYIDDEGEIIVRPKYLYGSDYYKGYAVVRNYNNLYGILDGEGKNEIAFGNIFSANLYGNRYIVSKFTNEGLKMGLLDSNLKEVTRFKYDNLSYSKSDVFMFTEGEEMGILNKDGKEIYTYKVDEVDDRNISVEVSNLTGDSTSDLYAKIKINESSTIINTKTGKEVYKYTLDDIYVLDNNVFYVKNDSGSNRYFVIKDDKIVYETSEYRRIRIEDLNSNIAIAIKEDSTIDYIDLLTKQKINQNGNTKYTYSDGIILEEVFNFSLGKNEFIIKNPSKTLGTVSDIDPVDDIFVNGYMKINTSNEKYSYINKKGDIITRKEYETASDFNENGYAVVSNNGEYGVINGNGKEIIGTKYDEIIMIDTDLFNNIKKNTKEELFIFQNNGKYGIINSDEKVVIKAIYDSFKEITTKYPIIQARYNNEDIIINLNILKELTIPINGDVEIYNNYIISNNEYYNYNGDLIYSIGG